MLQGPTAPCRSNPVGVFSFNHTHMNYGFVTRRVATELKMLGYKEPCYSYYNNLVKEVQFSPKPLKQHLHDRVPAPTWSEASRWLKANFDLFVVLTPDGSASYKVGHHSGTASIENAFLINLREARSRKRKKS